MYGVYRQRYKSLDNVKQVLPGTEWNRQKMTKCRNFRFCFKVSTRKFRLARLWKSLAKKFPTRLKKAISRRDWYRHQKFKKRRGLVGALKLSKIETIQATLCNQLGDGSLTYFAVLGDLNPSSNQQAVLDTS